MRVVFLVAVTGMLRSAMAAGAWTVTTVCLPVISFVPPPQPARARHANSAVHTVDRIGAADVSERGSDQRPRERFWAVPAGILADFGGLLTRAGSCMWATSPGPRRDCRRDVELLCILPRA